MSTHFPPLLNFGCQVLGIDRIKFVSLQLFVRHMILMIGQSNVLLPRNSPYGMIFILLKMTWHLSAPCQHSPTRNILLYPGETAFWAGYREMTVTFLSSFKIRHVMDEIAYSQLPHFMGHQLEASFIASWTVLIKKTNFAFYSIEIPPVLDEIAYSQLPHFIGHQLEASFIARGYLQSQMGCTHQVDQLCFLQHKNPTCNA